MSAFRCDAGITTLLWPAATALRTRVSISAIGSVIISFCSGLPARFHYARHLAPQRSLAEADPAHGEPAHVCPGPPAQPTPIVLLYRELRRPQGLGDHGLLRHRVLPLLRPPCSAVAHRRQERGISSVSTLPTAPRRAGRGTAYAARWNGMPNSSSSRRPSWSVRAEVTIVTSSPRTLSILS